MQLLFTLVYIRITILTWIFHDHPLMEYPLYWEELNCHITGGPFLQGVLTINPLSIFGTPVMIKQRAGAKTSRECLVTPHTP